MTRLFIVGEGSTEEAFVQKVLAPELRNLNVFAKPVLVETSPGHFGGGLNLDRVRRAVRNSLRQHRDAYVSTMFDLYALHSSFPGVVSSDALTPSARASHIERELHHDIVSRVGCRPDRFIPHIQPHEFESLLFSDIDRLCEGDPDWTNHRVQLIAVRNQVENPEWINESPQTAPSKRLEILRPRFKKSVDGPVAAARINLHKIREQCPHFSRWYSRIAALRAL
jgi:Domain of unknown function (DUF4276)